MKQLRRAVHTRHVAAGLAIGTAVLGVVAVGLPEHLYSYGLVDGQLTATNIGVFQTKYSIGPDRFGRYLQGRVQNKCDLPEFWKDGAGQMTTEENHCNIALNQKCVAMKATSIVGILFNCIAAALCLLDVHRSAVGCSAFASGMYGATWGLIMSIKLGKGTSPTARCGFTDHVAYPDIQYGVSFRLTVAASALSIIIAVMMISHQWTPSPPKLNQVDVLSRFEEVMSRPHGGAVPKKSNNDLFAPTYPDSPATVLPPPSPASNLNLNLDRHLEEKSASTELALGRKPRPSAKAISGFLTTTDEAEE